MFIVHLSIGNDSTHWFFDNEQEANQLANDMALEYLPEGFESRYNGESVNHEAGFDSVSVFRVENGDEW